MSLRTSLTYAASQGSRDAGHGSPRWSAGLLAFAVLLAATLAIASVANDAGPRPEQAAGISSSIGAQPQAVEDWHGNVRRSHWTQ